MSVKCVMCDKTWTEFTKANVIVHHRDDHQGNLIFLSDKHLRMMVKEVTDT